MSEANSNDNLKQQAVQVLMESLNDLIIGSRGDLQKYVQAMINDSVDAKAAGDDATVAQIQDQANSLLEVNRLRAVKGRENTVNRLVTLGITMLLRFVVPIPLPLPPAPQVA